MIHSRSAASSARWPWMNGLLFVRSWQFGGAIPGSTNDFSRNNQYGSLLLLTYLAFGGNGATIKRYNDFRRVIGNPC